MKSGEIFRELEQSTYDGVHRVMEVIRGVDDGFLETVMLTHHAREIPHSLVAKLMRPVTDKYIPERDWDSVEKILPVIYDKLRRIDKTVVLEYHIKDSLAKLYRESTNTKMFRENIPYCINLSYHDHKRLYDIYRIVRKYDDGSSLAASFNPYIIKHVLGNSRRAGQLEYCLRQHTTMSMLFDIYEQVKKVGPDESARFQEYVSGMDFDAIMGSPAYSQGNLQVTLAIGSDIRERSYIRDNTKRIILNEIASGSSMWNTTDECVEILPDIMKVVDKHSIRHISDYVIERIDPIRFTDAMEMHSDIKYVEESLDKIKIRILLKHEDISLFDKYVESVMKSHDTVIQCVRDEMESRFSPRKSSVEFYIELFDKYNIRDNIILDIITSLGSDYGIGKFLDRVSGYVDVDYVERIRSILGSDSSPLSVDGHLVRNMRDFSARVDDPNFMVDVGCMSSSVVGCISGNVRVPIICVALALEDAEWIKILMRKGADTSFNGSDVLEMATKLAGHRLNNEELIGYILEDSDVINPAI